MNKKIVEVIFKSIDEINETFSEEEHIPKELDTQLFGDKANLDSLGLVNLLVCIEQEIQDVFNKVITIADEKAMSQKNSPFRNVESLANYINMLLEEIDDE